jgi:hypothetical protein
MDVLQDLLKFTCEDMTSQLQAGNFSDEHLVDFWMNVHSTVRARNIPATEHAFSFLSLPSRHSTCHQSFQSQYYLASVCACSILLVIQIFNISLFSEREYFGRSFACFNVDPSLSVPASQQAKLKVLFNKRTSGESFVQHTLSRQDQHSQDQHA